MDIGTSDFMHAKFVSCIPLYPDAHGGITLYNCLSASLGRVCASRDHSFFVSRLSWTVVQGNEYLSAH